LPRSTGANGFGTVLAQSEGVRYVRNARWSLAAIAVGGLVLAASLFLARDDGRPYEPTGHGAILWTADAERPWDREWASSSCEDSSRFREVTSPVVQGRRAYRIEVRDGDDSSGERCELGQGNPTRSGFPLFDEGDERWISFMLLLPRDYPVDTPDWNIFMQLKQLGGLGTPVISMEAREGKFFLMNANNPRVSNDTIPRWIGPVRRDHWVQFTLHVKFSPHPQVGFLELYGDLDGRGARLLMPKLNTYTMKLDAAGVAVRSHARIGIYRDPEIQGTDHLFIDGYTVATTRRAAEEHARGDY
jgi:polysaccharide lyase-like protein